MHLHLKNLDKLFKRFFFYFKCISTFKLEIRAWCLHRYIFTVSTDFSIITFNNNLILLWSSTFQKNTLFMKLFHIKKLCAVLKLKCIFIQKKLLGCIQFKFKKQDLLKFLSNTKSVANMWCLKKIVYTAHVQNAKNVNFLLVYKL